jgi:alpha-L-rhamnosidase
MTQEKPGSPPAPASRLLRRGVAALFVVLAGPLALAQSGSPPPAPREHWSAEWISHPTAPPRERGVFHFRRIIHLDAKPAHFPVEVSADNHFLLYVNGLRIGEGPAKGDLPHWRYEAFELAPALHPGDNVIAATVFNFGIYAPLAVISERTAFLMQGESAAESAVDTNANWQVEEETGQDFLPRVGNGFMFYWAADPGEKLDAELYDWGWKDAGSSSRSHWVAAAGVMRETINPRDSIAVPPGLDSHNRWDLVPDTLPQMEFAPTTVGNVVRTNLPAAQQFPAAAVVIPPHAEVEILLDRATMVTGFPELTVSEGKGSQIDIGYTEALYDVHHHRGNRNEVGDRLVLGQFDKFLPDGGQSRTFIPLWFRTWRYLQLKIKTADEPLHLESLKADFSAFPFTERATFTSSDPLLADIWQICWRTARLGAHDTYMDTPFWEQLQYIDDTRVQSLISYTVPADDRLARQALQAFDDSRVPEGITQSRYPASLPQFIPNFSLSYIDMLRDYWMYRPDSALVQKLLPGTRPVLEWFFEKQYDDGFLKPLPYDSAWHPSQAKSALLTLTFVDTLRQAAELEDAFGEKHLAAKYRAAARKASDAVYRQCWNARLGLLADTPDQKEFSQYTNLYGVLTDAIPRADQAQVMRKIIAPNLGENPVVKLALVDYHAQFYLSRAIDKTGLGGYYLNTIGPWSEMLAMGLTTTPEVKEPTRSDTHAWSAHPMYDLLTIVAGIHPGSPGFSSVRIAPHPGALDHFEAAMPHEEGEIRVQYRHDETRATLVISLPQGLPGVLEWNGRQYSLRDGEQTLRLPKSLLYPSPAPVRPMGAHRSPPAPE